MNTELELSDEDDIVPLVGPRNMSPDSYLLKSLCSYKIGDAFFHVRLDQAQEMLGISTAKIEESIVELEDKLSVIRDEMTQLKVELYARFGRTINLET